MPFPRKSAFYGTTWTYCDNPSCPVREVIIAVKEDRTFLPIRGPGRDDQRPAHSAKF